MGTIALEMELAGRDNGWTAITDWRVSDGLRLDRGFGGHTPSDAIADGGTLSFVLNNAENNSARTGGYYSPGHPSCRPGFGLLIGVRVRVIVGSDSYVRFTGYLDRIAPAAGLHGPRSTDCEAIGWIGCAQRTRTPRL